MSVVSPKPFVHVFLFSMALRGGGRHEVATLASFDTLAPASFLLLRFLAVIVFLSRESRHFTHFTYLHYSSSSSVPTFINSKPSVFAAIYSRALVTPIRSQRNCRVASRHKSPSDYNLFYLLFLFTFLRGHLHYFTECCKRTIQTQIFS